LLLIVPVLFLALATVPARTAFALGEPFGRAIDGSRVVLAASALAIGFGVLAALALGGLQ
jgi:hypothetical protein